VGWQGLKGGGHPGIEGAGGLAGDSFKGFGLFSKILAWMAGPIMVMMPSSASTSRWVIVRHASPQRRAAAATWQSRR